MSTPPHRSNPAPLSLAVSALALLVVCLLASQAPAHAANYEDIVLANKVVARVRDPGHYASIWQRAAKINQNINSAFASEDVGHPRMWMAQEAGLWTIYIGQVRLLAVLPGDAAGAGRTTRELATSWMANFKQRFPQAEPVIHMDDPFGAGSSGPRGPGHEAEEDPGAPVPERHDEDLPADVRAVLDVFDQARESQPSDSDADDRELGRQLLSKLNLGGAPPDEDRALDHLLSAFNWVRRMSRATFETKRVRGAELALQRVRGCLQPLTRTAEIEPPPPPPGKVNLEYWPSVGDKGALFLYLAGPVVAANENGDPLLSAEMVISADIAVEVKELKEDSFVLHVALTNAKVSASAVPVPLEKDSGEALLEMDRYGRVLGVEVTQAPDGLPLGKEGLALLARLLGMARFKGEPVAAGDSWACDEEIPVGEHTVKIHAETEVTAIEHPVAKLLSAATADLPPLGVHLYSDQFPLQGGVLELEQVEREFDYQAAVPGPVKGKMLVDVKSESLGAKITIRGELNASLTPLPPEGGEGAEGP